MGSDWKKDLAGFFEEYAIIETSKKETLDDFGQFCEFIAEPAFENLAAELKEFGIRSKSRRNRGKSITFLINFPGTRIDNFHYAICLPKNSIELRLTLRIRGRKNRKHVLEEKSLPFMDGVNPAGVLKLKKEDIISNVIKHYRNFVLESLTTSL
ncbi:MAG: hypothetical protein JSV17_08995 [Candidatus Aminicenantes bacterium]|nr:MAG: hypothetical protein JSV17_08995 [Candidatus Aminicenantes bacterium]